MVLIPRRSRINLPATAQLAREIATFRRQWQRRRCVALTGVGMMMMMLQVIPMVFYHLSFDSPLSASLDTFMEPTNNPLSSTRPAESSPRHLWPNHPNPKRNEIYSYLTKATTTRIATNSPLRLDWTNLTKLSPIARDMEVHQRNCQLPVANFWYRNRFGLGSDLHVWSQAACNALQAQYRIRTLGLWIWRDETICNLTGYSTMSCYFPHAEQECTTNITGSGAMEQPLEQESPQFNLSRGRGRVRNECQSLLQRDYPNTTTADVRASMMEFLFTSVSRLLQQEAERQYTILFARELDQNHTTTAATAAVRHPSDLVTVHIRWGDKSDEMSLVPIADYIKAVQHLRRKRHLSTFTVPVLVATEDPRALYEFVRAIPTPHNWTIYVDVYFQETYRFRGNYSRYNGIPQLAQKLQGHSGLVALGSLLVALEANDFVLTTASNWSRLLNELRRSVIDPRCQGCTRMIDLRKGEW